MAGHKLYRLAHTPMSFQMQVRYLVSCTFEGHANL